MNGKRYGRGLIAAFSALVAVVAIILAVFVISGDEADLSYRSVDFDARLQSNGDIRFTEHLDYQLKRREDGNGDTKPWKQLYLTFKLRNQDLTNITDISVTNASTGEEYTQTDPQLPSGISDGTWDSTYAGHWYIADVTAGSDSPQPFDPTTDGIDPNGSGEQKNIEIGWNIPATVKQSSLKFDVSMTFHDMGTRHSDVTNLMWEMFPENNQVPAGKVTGTVRFPKGIASNNSWAWLHTEATSQTSRDADGTLHFTISDLRTNQYVDLVAAFDNTGAAGVERTQSGDYLDELKSTEAAKERQWRDRQRLKAQLTVAGWLICLIIGVLCCVLAIRGVLSANREARYQGGIEYWRDPPQVSPAASAHLIDVVDESVGDRSSRAMTATILALVVKKALAVYPGPSSLYQGIDLSQANASDLARMIASDPNRAKATASTSTLVIMPAALSHRNTLGLSQSEEACLELLIGISMRVGSPVFDFNQMDTACSDWEEGYQSLNRFKSACDLEFGALGAVKSVNGRWLVPSLCLMVIGAIGIFANGASNIAMALCLGVPFICIGVFCMAAGRSEGITERGQQYAGECLGLKRYMEDFSNFSNRGALDLTLWNWYMVYAAAFGISEKVAREFARAYPEVNDPQWLDTYGYDSLGYWTYRSQAWNGPINTNGMMPGGMYGGTQFMGGIGDIGSQISSGFASVSSTISAAAPSSSSGSGGSFSGGGFGGGGGGGSHKPTVTIPDDVPTGLNGDDHYAYIVGYPDSTVRPQNGITRAEVATIFFRLLTDETRNANSTKTNSYSDVAAGAWYNHAVSTLSAMGIVKGDSQGKFNPNAPITRAEFAAIAARFDDKANTTAVDFSDIASHWAKNEISAAANNGWINGYTDGTFRPNNKITRAEAMTLVNRVLKRLPETAEDLHNDMIKWSDNSDTSAWYYLAVQEATNSHYYDLKENKHEKWSKLRETRDWTELEK